MESIKPYSIKPYSIKPYSCGLCGEGFDKQADASLHLHANHPAFVTFNNITCRELLIGMAMQGILANPETTKEAERIAKNSHSGTSSRDIIALISFEHADAVIKKLSEEK